MANLLDVIVDIDIKATTGNTADLGKPLIIAEMASPVAYLEYGSLQAVETAFTGTTATEMAIKAMATTIFSQDHKPTSIAIACVTPTEGETASAALVRLVNSVYDRDWYYLLSVDNEPTTITALGDAIEANKRKMFVTRTNTSEVVATTKLKAYRRTVVFFHETVGEYPDAGLVGECCTQTIGSITWKFKTIAGLTPGTFTQTELDGLHADGAIAYVTKAGDNITSEGIVASKEYIDVINAMDWIQFNVENRVQKLFNSNPKIPYTNTGIAMLENEVVGVLQTAYANGIIADNEGIPDYSTNFPGRSEVSAEIRRTREYELGTFEATLEGAIHSTVLRGFISM